LFEISGSTKPGNTTDAIAAARQEVERIRTSEVTGAELETASETAVNSFVFHFDTPTKTLARLLRYEYYGYPKDFIFQFQKSLAEVTRADVLRAAQARVHPAEMTIVAVGNPREFGKPLTALGLPVHPIDLAIPPPQAAAGAGE
jgi:zinc protease